MSRIPGRFASLIGALILMGMVPARAQATWPHDPNNGNLAVCTAASEQSAPTVDSDGAGGILIAWGDYRSGSQDVYAQRVDAAGVPQWTPQGVQLCTDPAFRFSAQLVSDGAGGAIVTWLDYRNGNSDVFAQRVDASGAVQWAATGVAICTDVSDQQYQTTVPDGAGGAIIAWFDDRNGTNDIFVQRVTAAGTTAWTVNGVAICTATGEQYGPALATDGAGGAIAAWTDLRGGGSSDIYAQRVDAAGAPQWTADGVSINSAAFDQNYATVVSDGSGGAIVAWADGRSGTFTHDIYAQRVSGAGVTRWAFDGVALCTAGDTQEVPAIASDGAGGAIVTWYDRRRVSFTDIYAQRVSAGGAPQWTTDGVALCAVTGVFFPKIVSDGAGGAIVTWQDYRNVDPDIYAQRVNAAGSPLWTVNGAVVCAAVDGQVNPAIAVDGAGGAIVAWQDKRPGNNFDDIYAQRIERFGRLGNPEPSIVKIRDVPNDQGGRVNLQWTASYLDAVPGNPIDAYWIWRQVPIPAARDSRPLHESGTRTPGSTPAVGTVRATVESGQISYWEFVGSQSAHGFPGYSYTAPTTSDSVEAGNPRTVFMVEAEQIASGLYWGSAPDSGYSVDNLPPATPAPFTGVYGEGVASLHWGANGEPDFAYYELHRGTGPDFVPGPGNLVVAQPDTGYTYGAGQDYYYKLAAADIHGNRSGYALLPPLGTTGVPGDRIPAQLSLGRAQPNPARTGTQFRFALPRDGWVAIALFDPNGRRVRDLVTGFMPAGEHVAEWDGRDGAGRLVPSGVYFYRLEAEGRTLARRLVTIQD